MNAEQRPFLLAAIAGMLALPALAGADHKPGHSGPDGDKVPCWGINKCKGTGDCGADGCRHSGCHGSNACSGQGFVRLEKEVCLRIENGRLTKNPDAEKK